MDPTTIKALVRYNDWANQQVLDAILRVPEDVYSYEIHSLPEGSIHGVLTHIVWSEWIWLQRWRGGTSLVFQPAEFARVPRELVWLASDFPGLQTLRDRSTAVGAEMSEYVNGLGPEDLLRVIDYRTPSGEPWSRPLWRQVVHVVNHSTYHRGQVAVMLRAQGHAPAPSDLVGFEDAIP